MSHSLFDLLSVADDVSAKAGVVAVVPVYYQAAVQEILQKGERRVRTYVDRGSQEMRVSSVVYALGRTEVHITPSAINKKNDFGALFGLVDFKK